MTTISDAAVEAAWKVFAEPRNGMNWHVMRLALTAALSQMQIEKGEVGEDEVERVARIIAWSHGYFPEKVTLEELHNLPIGGISDQRTTDLISIARSVIQAIHRPPRKRDQ